MPIPAAMVEDEGLEGLKIAMLRNHSKPEELSYAVLRDIDFSGLAGVRVGVVTTKLFTRGGELSLRLDAADGRELGVSEIANNNLGIPETLDYYEFALAGISGFHDLYLVSTRQTDEDSNRPAFLLMTIEFTRAP